jgi:hypothetical protein
MPTNRKLLPIIKVLQLMVKLMDYQKLYYLNPEKYVEHSEILDEEIRFYKLFTAHVHHDQLSITQILIIQ